MKTVKWSCRGEDDGIANDKNLCRWRALRTCRAKAALPFIRTGKRWRCFSTAIVCTPSTIAARTWASRSIEGSVEEGILSCHWHHARFDLASGGAFDLWADDIDSYPVEVRDGEIYVDLRPAAQYFRASFQSSARWLAAQPQPGGRQSGNQHAEPRRGAGRALPHRAGVWHAVSRYGLGARLDHPRLHDESGPLAG